MSLWEWSLAALAALNLAALVVAVLLTRAQRRGVAQPGVMIETYDHPALVSDAWGHILTTNRHVLTPGQGAPADAQGDAQDGGDGQPGFPAAGLLEAALARLAEGIDATLIHRLMRRASTTGIASAEVPCRARDGLVAVVVAPLDTDRFLWLLVDPARLAEAMPRSEVGEHANAPFAYALQPMHGAARVNPAFAALFGPDPSDVFARIRAQGEVVRGGRYVLDVPGTGPRVFRAITAERDAGRALYLFDVGPADTRQAIPGDLLESLPIPVAQFDLTGQLLWRNRLARKLLGQGADPGMPMDALFDPLSQPLPSLIAEAADGTMTEAAMVRLKTGETFVQLALAPVEIEDRTTLLAVLTDASEVRRLEERFAQSQKMEAVGKLAGGIAHDFNNLLTAIAGHCDLLLLRKDPSHPDYADLTQITQNSNRAAALVRQLLAFSRKQTLNPTRLAIEDVLSDAHYLLDRLVGERVTLTFQAAPRLWPVRADAQQLEQALMNLVVNARDAMQGAGSITVSCQNLRLDAPSRSADVTLPRGDFVEICVTDTGPGIDPVALDKVFDPFFTTKPKGEGTGLGLSTVYGIVKQSGGYIEADNPPEGGARFRIRLPRAPETEAGVPAPAEEAPVRAAEAGDQTGSGTILLVEDEDPVRAFAARALRLRGYEVFDADSAALAMEILADPDRPIDLLISDVVMPGMDGPTFAREARRIRPGLKLIFISGYAEESFRKNLTETEFSFLPKPFSLNELTTRVKSVLTEAPEDA